MSTNRYSVLPDIKARTIFRAKTHWRLSIKLSILKLKLVHVVCMFDLSVASNDQWCGISWRIPYEQTPLLLDNNRNIFGNRRCFYQYQNANWNNQQTVIIFLLGPFYNLHPCQNLHTVFAALLSPGMIYASEILL